MFRNLKIYAVFYSTTFVVPASAQMDWIGPITQGALAEQLSENVMDNMGIPKDEADNEANKNDRQTSNLQFNSTLYSTKLTFTSSPSRRNANITKIKADYLKSNNNAQNQALADKLFSSASFSNSDSITRNMGLDSKNLGDVFALYIAINFKAVRDLTTGGNVNPNVVIFAKQMNQILSRQNTIRNLDDAQKQLNAEQLLAQIMIISVLIENSKTNPQLKNLAIDYGNAALKRFGFDQSRFDITSKGYVPKR
jgi:hypothetical protein